MPYNKKPRSTRKPAHRPKGRPGVTNAVKKYVKKVTARTRPEMKCFRNLVLEGVNLNTNTLAGAVYVNQTFPILVQGVGRDQRIGNEIYFHGFHSKGSLNNNGSVVVYVRRLILGYTTGIPTLDLNSGLFDNGTGLGVSATTIGSNMGLITTPINKAEFKVYFDKTMKLSPSTATDGSQTKLYNYFSKFGGKKIRYESNTYSATNQTWRFSEIFLVAQADNDTPGVTVEISENCAVYFTDP